jgi:type I restriction enzyme M protein
MFPPSVFYARQMDAETIEMIGVDFQWEGRLSNPTDLRIRNFILERARVLAVVGLHGNTFKPHTGTKTSVLFLQKYTNEDLAEIKTARERHRGEWSVYLDDLRGRVEVGISDDDELEEPLTSVLVEYFEDNTNDGDLDIDDESGGEGEDAEDREADLEALQRELEALSGRGKGRAQLQRDIAELRRLLAADSLQTRLEWLLANEDATVQLMDQWLFARASEELDYEIFFGVSDNGGKDNSGNPIYVLDDDGRPKLDEHGHLTIDHDLDAIADEFITFAKSQGLDFWSTR